MNTQIPSHDDTKTKATDQSLCPLCWTPFQRVGRQKYCSANCRKTAWARTHTTPHAIAPIPAQGQRRDNTIYQCSECDQRYLGTQWCPDCNQPANRIGLGGSCPNCEEPVAVTDLLDTIKETRIR